MKNAWLVRPFPGGIRRVNEFKSNNIVAIGWPCIGDLTGKLREDIKSILADPPYNLSGIKLGNAYATVDIFVNRMQKGDLVLVPDGEDIYFGELISDYYLNSSVDNMSQGYPHQRKVKWHSNSLRTDLSMPLRLSLKVHRATADLTKHLEEIDLLTQGKKFPDGENNAVDPIKVTYPLRTDFTISFEIPSDISSDEAKRLSKYIESLYFEK